MDPQQQIERLYENESLTDNLTDTDARALLQWAEEQIRGRTDGALVTAAVRNANQSGTEGVQALLAHAQAFLAVESGANQNVTADNTARDAEPSPIPQEPAPEASDAARPDAVRSNDSGQPAMTVQGQAASSASETKTETTTSNLTPLGTAGASGVSAEISAQADAKLAPETKPPRKKSRRMSKRSQK